MKPEFWNDRYASKEYIYGREPNVFFREQLAALPIKTGSILFAAEGEGRNAVHAAKQGWQVTAFDQSEEGRKKALQLAAENKVKITYEVAGFPETEFESASFDAIVFIFAHVFPELKMSSYAHTLTFLKPGGFVLFECYGKKHSEYQKKNPKAGGPGNPDMLFSEKELRQIFADFTILHLEEREADLREGDFHSAPGWVIDLVAKKKDQKIRKKPSLFRAPD